MKTTFATQTLVSFHMWLDNYIQQNGQAYYTTTSPLFYQPDPKLNSNYVAYNAPFKSLVCDSGVSGATIMTSVSGSLGHLSLGQSGMMVDFDNARVILPATFGTNQTLSGTYSFKELNVYKSNETQETTVFTNKYYLNSRFARPITGIPPPNAFVTPCVFIINAHEENANWAIGGLYNTTFTMSLSVFAENMSQLEGTLSLLTDSKDLVFPCVPTSAWPLDAYGAWKNGSGYNYQTVIAQYGTVSNLFQITDCKASKLTDYMKVDENIFIGLADVTVTRVRTIH